MVSPAAPDLFVRSALVSAVLQAGHPRGRPPAQPATPTTRRPHNRTRNAAIPTAGPSNNQPPTASRPHSSARRPDSTSSIQPVIRIASHLHNRSPVQQATCTASHQYIQPSPGRHLQALCGKPATPRPTAVLQEDSSPPEPAHPAGRRTPPPALAPRRRTRPSGRSPRHPPQHLPPSAFAGVDRKGGFEEPRVTDPRGQAQSPSRPMRVADGFIPIECVVHLWRSDWAAEVPHFSRKMGASRGSGSSFPGSYAYQRAKPA